MSANPFTADPAIRKRLESIDESTRNALRAAARSALPGNEATGKNRGGVLDAQVVATLVSRFELDSVRDLMLLLLGEAERFANPGISGFHVGAVGLEADTGNLILGGNVEFPGLHLGYTLHGEGFVFTRAMSRGRDVEVIAIGEAHPCAHCRQCLAEYAASDRLQLIDPLGHTLTMAQLYPWPFDPAYLGERGAVPGKVLWPDLGFNNQANRPLADKLLDAGRRSHTPYSKAPAALLLGLKGGQHVIGIAIESVAFNPTIQPVQAAVVDLLAHGFSYSDITGALLGAVADGPVDYAKSTNDLLASIAPAVSLETLEWSA